jgi:hypothetical protein
VIHVGFPPAIDYRLPPDGMIKMIRAMHEWIEMIRMAPRANRQQIANARVSVGALRRMADDCDAVARAARLRADELMDQALDCYRYHHDKSRSRERKQQ